MIIKGSARGKASELATHLLRPDTNERVTVLELHGVASLDLRGALNELYFMGAGSRSERRLYHASINTPSHEPLSFVEQHRARERLAEEFDLTDQPYVMVEHIKHGRQHLHIVWSRVDPEKGKAISDSYNYRKHEIVSRDLALEFGRTPVAGVHIRDKAREPRPARALNWGEQLQAERSGISPAEIKETVTALWHATSTGHDFIHGLEAEGFVLARGNRRDFVLVDRGGEIYGLTKKIDGARAADVRERMSDVDVAELLSVGEAQTRQRELRQARKQSFLSTADRMRLEELQREAEARASGRPKLEHTHQDLADAIWQLKRTMRGDIERTIPGHQEQRRPDDLIDRMKPAHDHGTDTQRATETLREQEERRRRERTREPDL